MLILSRRKDERIKIGDAVEVMVTDIQGDNVRLGITAPAGVKIVRDDAKRLSPPPARITEEAADSPQVTLYVVPEGQRHHAPPGIYRLAARCVNGAWIVDVRNGVTEVLVNRTWLDQFARQFALVKE